MKKKFITGLLLLAVTATGFSTFTSCKDTDDDMWSTVEADQARLKDLLDQLRKDLEANKCTCADKLLTEAQVKQWINDKANELATTYTLQHLKDEMGKLTGNGVTNLTADQVNNLKALAAQAQTLLGLNQSVQNLQKWFDGIGIDEPTFQEYVKQGAWVKNNKEVLDAVIAKKAEIEKLNATALDALNKYQADLSKIEPMYSILFPNGTEGEWWNYQQVMDNIKANTKAIEDLQKDVDYILGRINDMVTSLVLQATGNPVFGAINTPFGINSMVLMSYYGKIATQLREFPATGVGAEYSGKDVDVNWAAIPHTPYQIENSNLIALDAEGQASLGNLWFTVNPATVNNINLDGFALVNSKEVESKVSLSNIVKDDDVEFKFGITTRAEGNGNGLYRADAKVAPESLDAIKVNIEPGLKDALINAVKNHTATDIAYMLKAVYNQLQNICELNALRYTWTSKNQDAAGNWVDFENRVYSNYGIAATSIKPLSFATLYGESLGSLPTIDPIELDKSLVDLNLKPFEIGDVTLNIELNIAGIEINNVGETIIKVKVPKKFDVDVDTNTGEGEAVLPDNWEDNPEYYDVIEVDITGDLQAVVDSLKESIDEWVGGLDDQINQAIKDAVDEAFNGPNGLITNIEGQVNDMMGSIQDKLDSLVDKINSDYLGKVNSIIDKYNSVAERINKFLANPNHYLQAAMLYKDAQGKLHLLSTNPNQPSQFKGNGNAIEIWATTYNFETIAPAFKKFVGVTSVKKNGVEQPSLVAAANKSANFMATVLDGDRNRVALDVAGATNGVYTYELAYQALDYTGHTSTVKCYVQVVR